MAKTTKSTPLKTKTVPYDVAMQLRLPEEVAAYLDAWLKETPDDTAGIARALGDIALARWAAASRQSTLVERLRLHRQSDSLVYEFERAQRSDGSIGYRRTDQDVWIVHSTSLGWVAVDDETGEVTGRPWNVPPHHQGECPPEGDWVSKKGSKSYVYSLRYAT